MVFSLAGQKYRVQLKCQLYKAAGIINLMLRSGFEYTDGCVGGESCLIITFTKTFCTSLCLSLHEIHCLLIFE